MSVHQEYRLFISPEAYTLVGDHSETLTIDRTTGQLDLKRKSVFTILSPYANLKENHAI